MVRPTKKRRVTNVPEIKFFKPAKIPRCDLEEVVLTIEEVEAIRLKDKLGLTQEESAQEMEVSRPTFQRILIEARFKIADALLEGKSIKFAGGNYKLSEKCNKCGREFKKRNKSEKCNESKLCAELDE